MQRSEETKKETERDAFRSARTELSKKEKNRETVKEKYINLERWDTVRREERKRDKE